MIFILEQEIGNSKAIIRMLRKLAIPFTTNINFLIDMKEIKGIILPGNGSFDSFMESCRAYPEFENSLTKLVIDKSVPVLGICVGMQALFNKSEEGLLQGFGFVPGKIKKFRSDVRVPHVGWKKADHKSSFQNNAILVSDKYFFSHSFAYFYENPSLFDELLISDYKQNFVAAFRINNIIGAQFHPEKSSSAGFVLMQNFWRLCKHGS